MSKIVVFGSTNIDLFISTERLPEEGETIFGKDFFIAFGGKGANQAVAASRLGADVDFISCVGKDQFGIEAIKNLQRENINTKYIQEIEGETSVAIIMRINHDNRIILHNETNKKLEVKVLKDYLNEHKEAKIFITQFENSRDENLKAIKIARNKGLYTIFNPAPALDIPPEYYKFIDLLIINQSETYSLCNIYPRNRMNAKKVYKYFHELGLDNLIITLGKTGSILCSEEGINFFSSNKVKTVDATGAGDSYIGAIAYMLSKNKNLEEAMAFATIVASLSVMKKGAQQGMPTVLEINKYLEENKNGK